MFSWIKGVLWDSFFNETSSGDNLNDESLLAELDLLPEEEVEESIKNGNHLIMRINNFRCFQKWSF